MAATRLAADLKVLSSDERVLVIQIDEASAIAIVIARANGLLLVPLLQSVR